MKTIKYILIFVLSFATVTSCLVEDTEPSAKNDEGLNIAGFTDNNTTLGAIASGDTYDFDLKIEVKGPTYKEMTSDVVLTIEVDPTSTAIEGTHFEFATKTATLKASNNYLGYIGITMLSEGIVAPLDVAPVLKLRVTDASSDANVINNGKLLTVNFNYLCFSNLSGVYDATAVYTAYSGAKSNLEWVDTISETGTGEYRTTEVGHWLGGLGVGTPGFTFYDICNSINIPGQNLVETYGNWVAGAGSVDPDTGIILCRIFYLLP
jgi:hypothetical protein